MFKKLTLKNFKNFKNAELTLGPFTVLVGANATGKSNIREAFRFLHGIGRGYNIPEIIGENWDSSGQKIWDGIRGGTSELSYLMTFTKSDELKIIPTGDFSIGFNLVQQFKDLNYFIKIVEGHVGDIVIPYILEESLRLEDNQIFHIFYDENKLVIRDENRGTGEDIINQRYEFLYGKEMLLLF